MANEFRMYINGEWCDAQDGETIAVTNAANGEVIREVPYGRRADCAKALGAADGAFDDWRHMNAHDRGGFLKEAADLIRERADEIALTMTLETGKPVPESKGETLASAAYYEWYAEEGKRVYGRMIPSSRDGVRRWVIKHPVGVCGASAPWNFPVVLPIRKIGAALSAGCTIVTRPSSQAPLAATMTIECLHDAGLPAGVVNHVIGDAEEISAEMLQNPVCKKLSFTGSTAVGKELMRGAADQLKKLSLELGGSAPALVFPDVDVDAVAEQTVKGKFRNNGQVCIAATRFYAHESIFDEYVERVIHHTGQLRQGYGWEEGTDVGPLINEAAVERTESFVADAVKKGARVACGGKRPEGKQFAKGAFYEPTVLLNISGLMRLSCEEVFGPVMPIMAFSDTQDAIRKANDTPYGLASYVFTRDLSTAMNVCEELEFAMVGLNDMVFATCEAPFGGMKESGLHREGAIEGVEAYLETKYISVGL